MLEDFKTFCENQKITTLRDMMEEGPSKSDLSNYGINENQFFITVEETMMKKYSK